MSMALAFLALPLGMARAQVSEGPSKGEQVVPPPLPSYGTGAPVPFPLPDNGPVETVPDGTQRCLSDWITYRRGGCCTGPIGGDPPLVSELYIRTGLSFPFGGQTFSHVSDVGWSIQGGGRMLFFDMAMERAWTVDVGISSHYNRADDFDTRIPLNIIVPNEFGIPTRVQFGAGGIPGVTIHSFHRTFVNAALGREVYLRGSALDPGGKLRVGWDAGGGWGSGSAEFHQIRHRVDVIGRAFVAVHSDLEIPCGCCTFQAGLRSEYSYTFSDILQAQSDLQEINLLFNFGVRY
jgi:hypothetical protein